MAVCARDGCNKPSFNGKKGEYCSKRCRNTVQSVAAHELETGRAVCARDGCNNFSFNGKAGEYCSRSCRSMPQAVQSVAAHELETASAVVPTCARSGCSKAPWNGLLGEYCSRGCREVPQASGSTAMHELLDGDVQAPSAPKLQDREATGRPSLCRLLCRLVLRLFSAFSRLCGPILRLCRPFLRWICMLWQTAGGLFQRSRPRAIPFRGPIPNSGVVAFYYPGYNTPADDRCQAAFLGNFYARSLHICSGRPAESSFASFENAEAAFQSLKYWDRKELFQNLAAEEAFRLSRQLGAPDMTYGGYGSNWQAMLHVLRQKFQDSELQNKLLATGNALLLEHNTRHGRDRVWSNNQDGSGTNWLGLQLMLLRDEVRRECRSRVYEGPWTMWLQEHVNLSTGECLNAAWPDLVKRATVVTLAELCPEEV